MEKLKSEFTVNRPITETWNVLTDVERIAPCMPGATLEEIEGDVFRGVVKVKLGAISTAFKGQASFVERDDAAHRAVLKGEGRDTTGKGNASALITAQLESLDPERTKCNVETDLHVSGKVAQFGRGIMGDVSKKLMDQFANNLNTMLGQQPETPQSAPQDSNVGAAQPVASDDAPAVPEAGNEAASSVAASTSASTSAPTSAATSASTTASTSSDGSASRSAGTPAPQVRKIDGPAAAPIELSDVAGRAIIKRALPLFGGLVLLLVVLRRITRH